MCKCPLHKKRVIILCLQCNIKFITCYKCGAEDSCPSCVEQAEEEEQEDYEKELAFNARREIARQNILNCVRKYGVAFAVPNSESDMDMFSYGVKVDKFEIDLVIQGSHRFDGEYDIIPGYTKMSDWVHDASFAVEKEVVQKWLVSGCEIRCDHLLTNWAHKKAGYHKEAGIKDRLKYEPGSIENGNWVGSHFVHVYHR